MTNIYIYRERKTYTNSVFTKKSLLVESNLSKSTEPSYFGYANVNNSEILLISIYK